MDLERGLASIWNSSSSSSPSSSSRSSSSSAVVAVADRMELEAAEALADLAHSATRESCAGDSGSQWGSKGKRAKKRVKSESPPADPVFDAAPPRSPPALSPSVDRTVGNRQLCEPTCLNVELDPVKVEPDGDLPKASLRCGKSCPPLGGGRSRQNLTEAEKEERRLRRILANRESARQTIRRRQALCDELTRKAADLAWENQNLRREMELTLKDYQSLETTNMHLKAQLFKVVKTEAEESLADLKPGALDIHGTLSTTCPLPIYNQHTFSQFCWPSILQTSNPAHSHQVPPHAIVIPPNVPMPIGGKLDSCQQDRETSINVNRSITPLYVVPCPWFFPLADDSNGVHAQHSFSLQHVQSAASKNNQVSSSTSSRVAASSENGHPSFAVKVKSEAASSTEVRVIDDLNEMPVGSPSDGGCQCGAAHPKELIPNFVAKSPVNNDSGLQSVYASRITGICSKSSQLISAPPEKNQDAFKCQIKKLLDATVATEARRRRKELTKLKNLHGRQCQANC